MTNFRVIHTGTYGQKMFDALQSVIGQLSDGMWENSPSMDRYWRFATIEQMPTKEVIIKVSTDQYETERYSGYKCKYIVNGFVDMTDAEVLAFFAKKMVAVARQELRDDESCGKWKRDNDSKLCYLSRHDGVSISVVEVMYMHDYLVKKVHGSYGNADIVNGIVGIPASAEEIHAELERRAKIDAINKEYAERIAKMKADKEAELKAITDKYNLMQNEIYNWRKSQIENV